MRNCNCLFVTLYLTVVSLFDFLFVHQFDHRVQLQKPKNKTTSQSQHTHLTLKYVITASRKAPNEHKYTCIYLFSVPRPRPVLDMYYICAGSFFFLWACSNAKQARM